MNQVRQTIVSSILIGVMGFHILMLLLYLLPTNLLTIHFGKINREYMRPFFYQNWHLFSPNPGFAQTRIWFRYQVDDGQWSEWSDPIDHFQRKHERNRFFGGGRRNRIFRQVVDSIRKTYHFDSALVEEPADGNVDKSNEKPVQEPETKDEEHARRVKQVLEHPVADIVRRVAKDWAKTQSLTSHPTAIQYQLMRFYPRRYSNTNKLQRFEKVVKIQFPPISLERTMGLSREITNQ